MIGKIRCEISQISCDISCEMSQVFRVQGSVVRGGVKGGELPALSPATHKIPATLKRCAMAIVLMLW